MIYIGRFGIARAVIFYASFVPTTDAGHFFIMSSEDEGLDILHRFGLAFVVELVEGRKEGGLLGKS